MNNPSQSPLVPQGSMLEQKNRSRARVRLAVFFVLSIHVIGLMALLMQGCRKQEVDAQPPVDTNAFANTMQPVLDTNPPPVAAAMPTNNPPPNVAAPTAQTYTVAAGDNYSTIAKKFPGVTARAIQEANPGVDPLKIRPGQVIHIPAPAAPATSTTSTTAMPTQGAAAADGEQMYTVQSGDNLTKIADKFKTTVRALRSANNLTTDRITVGQKLKIPAHTAPPAPMASPAPAGSSHPTT